MYNYVNLIGKVAKDIEVEKKDDKTMCEIVIASTRPFRNSQGEFETDFIPVHCYDYIAELVGEYFKKGSTIALVGRLVQAKNGSCKVVASRIMFLDKIEPKETI